jgi:hypothetical protein
MLVALIVLVSVTCLLLGLTIGPLLLVWIALGLSLVGLVLIAVSGIHRRRGARPAEQAGVERDAPTGVDDAVTAPAVDRAAAPCGDVGVVAADPDEPDTDRAVPRASSESDPEPIAAAVATTPAAVADGADRDGADTSGADGRTDAIVLVVPGRRRFHRDGCRVLVNRASEEIVLDEALDEGFSPCTVCIPGGAGVPTP